MSFSLNSNGSYFLFVSFLLFFFLKEGVCMSSCLACQDHPLFLLQCREQNDDKDSLYWYNTFLWPRGSVGQLLALSVWSPSWMHSCAREQAVSLLRGACCLKCHLLLAASPCQKIRCSRGQVLRVVRAVSLNPSFQLLVQLVAGVC